MDHAFLPGLPATLIRAAYEAAPGNEIASGKFLSPESSSALVANTFGLFLSRPGDLPPLPGCSEPGWPAASVQLEAIVRFPWSGGRHPCLDVLVETETALIGIESKRYEPFRSKSETALSDAYWRAVWGDAMAGYERVRDELRPGALSFRHLDAGQLVKHAFGLRTAVHRPGSCYRKRPVLLYLHAEPAVWPDGRIISDAEIELHRVEVGRFAEMVVNDEVLFRSCTYRQLFAAWNESGTDDLRAHTEALMARFAW